MATTSSLNDYLLKLYAARDAATSNKSFTIGSTTYTRQNLPDLEELISKYEARISRRTNGSRLDVEIVK